MAYTIREIGPIKLVGKVVETFPLGHPQNDPMLIPNLWSSLMESISVNQISITGPMFGAMKMHGEGMTYLAGLESETAPDGFEIWEIPAQKYVVFEHKGSLETLGQTIQNIFMKEFPESGLKHSEGIALEIYDERFDASSPDSVFELAFPIA